MIKAALKQPKGESDDFAKRLSAHINNQHDPLFAWGENEATPTENLATMIRYEDIRALLASWRELGEALKECADDLEVELRDRYCFNGSSEPPHPSLKRQFDRDMETVRRARAALKAAGEK